MRTGATSIRVASVLGAIVAAETAVVALDGGPWWFELAVGGAVCTLAALLTIRSDRAAAAGLAVSGAAVAWSWGHHLPSQPGLAATAGLLILGARSVRVARPWLVGALVVAGAAVFAAGRGGRGDAYLVVTATAGVLTWGAAVGVGLWQRWMDREREAAVEEARRTERLGLARELHDVAAHHLTGIVLQAQAATLVGSERPDLVSSALRDIEAAATEALDATRTVVGLLRSPDTARTGTVGSALLESLVRDARRRGVAVEAHLPGPDQERSWPADVRQAVFHLVQEALTNVARHAGAAGHVSVVVEPARSSVRVAVTDDAPRPDGEHQARGTGFGLIGLRERIDDLGGTFAAGPGAGDGWVVEATVPLTERSR